MSIINNAYAGSQIPLTCMIYRVLSRNDGQLTVDEITALCAPANLTVNENQRKKFRAELNFWMKKEHQLWYQNSESKLCLVDSKVESTPSSIATIINSILYASPIKDLFDKKTEHVMRDLVIFLGCILSHDRYLPYSSKLIESISTNKIISQKTLVNINIPDSDVSISDLEYTRLGKRGNPLPATNIKNTDLYKIGAAGPPRDNGKGTDFHAINNNKISVSPILYDLTDSDALNKINNI